MIGLKFSFLLSIFLVKVNFYLDERMSSSRNILAKDRFDQPVFLFENDFALRWFADKYPDVELEEKMWLSTNNWN